VEEEAKNKDKRKMRISSTNKCPLALLLFGAALGASVALAGQPQSVANGPNRQAVGAVSAQEAPKVSATSGLEEPYQKIYETFAKLLQSSPNGSLASARCLVGRLNDLVGLEAQRLGSGGSAIGEQPAGRPLPSAARDMEQQQGGAGSGNNGSHEEKTEQILTRLDQVNTNTDQRTIRQLQEDVNRLVNSLSDSYLRNIRRLIERVDRILLRQQQQQQNGGASSSSGAQNGQSRSGRPANSPQVPADALHQSGDRFQDQNEANRPPGFPGWDELIVAVDRMQKSLASFVRSSTKLITSGRR